MKVEMSQELAHSTIREKMVDLPGPSEPGMYLKSAIYPWQRTVEKTTETVCILWRVEPFGWAPVMRKSKADQTGSERNIYHFIQYFVRKCLSSLECYKVWLTPWWWEAIAFKILDKTSSSFH